jgi:hypothetical protein
MSRKNYLFLTILLATIVVVACKKDPPYPEPTPIDPYLAPCEINEKTYHLDSVYYGPSARQLEAKYRVRFIDTTNTGGVSKFIEYAFNKVPVSGKYTWVDKIDTDNVNLPNQIAFYLDSGSFIWRSNFSEGNYVYIKNTSHEMIISYCNVSDTSIMFDAFDQCFKGIRPASRKLKIQH